MPYKEGKRWRATPKYRGERLPTKLFGTKREASAYEARQRKIAKDTEKRQRSGMDLLTFCGRYLDHATRFVDKVYREKKALTERILTEWGPDCLVASIDENLAEQYLLKQKDERSANASNKDRKNLCAMWNWGKKILKVEANPFMVIEKQPHDVSIPETYIEDEILLLLAAANRDENLILRLFLETAGRRNEIFSMAVQDVNIERRMVRLWTRKTRDGSREGQWLPITEHLAGELQWWLKARPLKKSVWLIPNKRTGKPYVDPRKWLYNICDRAKVRQIGFHAFRRYVASILDDKYKSSRKSIQNLLRHKKESTTERYLYQIHSDLRDMAGKAVPEEKVHMNGTHEQKKEVEANAATS